MKISQMPYCQRFTFINFIEVISFGSLKNAANLFVAIVTLVGMSYRYTWLSSVNINVEFDNISIRTTFIVLK